MFLFDHPECENQVIINESEFDQLQYVLKFALKVIEDNDLQQIKNSDNWRIGKSLEDQIDITSAISLEK